MSKQVQERYNPEDLLIEVLEKLNAETVAYLKTKAISENTHNQNQ